MDKTLIKQFNERGWIPGPEEDEQMFEKRIQALNHFFSYPPSEIDDFLTDGEWQSARQCTMDLFGFSSETVVAYYSNRNLNFFQGAVTWIIDQSHQKIPLIQLRKNFQKETFLKLYQRQEVLAHESVHAARQAYEEPKYEEIFAYLTAKNRLRRIVGPIFQKTWESLLTVLLIFLSLISQTLLLFYCDDCDALATGLFLLPWAFLMYLGIRLSYRRFQLRCCLKKIKTLLIHGQDALPFVFRLTDSEIDRFAKSSEREIQEYIHNQRHHLRWKWLISLYSIRL